MLHKLRAGLGAAAAKVLSFVGNMEKLCFTVNRDRRMPSAWALSVLLLLLSRVLFHLQPQMHKDLGLCHGLAVVASEFTAEEQTRFWIGGAEESGGDNQ